MAKTKVSEWSSNPADNTDIGGIDIAEGCAPSGINNAIRTMMAQIKDEQTGSSGDSFDVGGNLTVGGNSVVDGNSTVSGTSTLSGVVTATNGVVGNLTGNVTGNATGNLISVTNTVIAGNFIVGNTYTISTVGTTDFTLIGATSNTVGVLFTATGVGTGTGTATTFTGRAVNVTGTVAVANGGTGATSLTANAVLLGNGTSSPQSVLPSTNANVLTSTAGATVTAGSFVVGTQYTILSVGSTTWTSIGAASNTVGVVFTATGSGSGTGTATTNVWTSQALTIPTPSALSTATGSAPSYSARAFVNFNGATADNIACTYVQSGTTVTVTLNSGTHSLLVGNRVYLDFTSGSASDGIYTIATVPDNTHFTVTRTSATTSGSVNINGRLIRNAKNVNFVSFAGNGYFIVNFTTAMSDANYSIIASASDGINIHTTTTPDTQSFALNGSNSTYVNAVVFA